MKSLPYPRMPEDKSSGLRHVRYMNMLSKVAADIDTPVKGNNRMAACIVYRNDVVAFGINERKSHPFQARYLKNEHAIYLHAEISAVKNALKYITVEELERSTLYVCRVKYHDMKKKQLIFGLSKPCCGCEHCITSFGIKNVIYSLDNTGFSVL